MHAIRSSYRITFGLLILLSAAFLPMAGTAQTVDVWIDPGHGADDSGTKGIAGQPAKYEKALALQVSNVLHSRLGQLGFSSSLTRNSDVFFRLEERAEIVSGLRQNDVGEQGTGQVAVCIHMNGVADTTVFGTETFYTPAKKFSKKLDAYRVDSTYASAVHTNMMSQAPLAFLGCHNNRGLKRARFVVVKEARIPGVYVEVCFISNRCQQDKIAVQGNQALIASGIAAGIGQVISPGGFLARSATQSSESTPNARDTAEVETSGRSSPIVHGAASVVQSLQVDFESATFPPPGWTTMSQGQPIPYQWHRAVAPLYAHGGVAAARIGGESPTAINEWLISPLTLLGGSDTGLKFYWNSNRQFAQNVNAECLIRPSGSGTWTQLWSLQSEPDGTEFQYRDRVVDVTPWVGSQVEFAFRVSGTNGAEFVLDDVATGAFAPTATPSNDLCSAAIAISAGTRMFLGSTCYASNNLDAARLPGSCTADSLSGRDVFYWVSAAAGDTLQAAVTGPWAPVLYLVNACAVGPGTCLNSAPKFQDGDITSASLQHVFAASGVYFLVVDGVSGECGDFQLTTHIRNAVTGVERHESVLPGRSFLHARPNPSSGLVQFAGRRTSTGESAGVLRIFDVSGRLDFVRSITISGDSFAQPWDGRSTAGARLSSGVYVAKVEIGAEVLITRFVLAQ